MNEAEITIIKKSPTLSLYIEICMMFFFTWLYGYLVITFHDFIDNCS